MTSPGSVRGAPGTDEIPPPRRLVTGLCTTSSSADRSMSTPLDVAAAPLFRLDPATAAVPVARAFALD